MIHKTHFLRGRSVALLVVSLATLFTGLSMLMSHTPVYAVHTPPESQADCQPGERFDPGGTGGGGTAGIYNPPSCINNGDNPRSQADCPPKTTFQPAGGAIYTPAKCVSAPQSQNDCPAYTIFQPGGGNTGIDYTPAKCVSAPKSDKDCPPDTYFDPGNPGNDVPMNYIAPKCVKKSDVPRSQADCPKGSTYQAAGSGNTALDSSQATCIKIEASSQEDCDSALPGSFYDTKTSECKDPTQASDCPSGYKFEKGTSTLKDPNSDPDRDKHNKCTKTDQDSCIIPSQGVGYTPLRWAVCPVIEGLNYVLIGCPSPIAPDKTNNNPNDKTFTKSNNSSSGQQADNSSDCSGGLQGAIRSFLYTDESSIFDRSQPTGGAYYKSWEVFRALGVGLIIIAGLIMIVSEAFGVDIVDAYTIRKLMPRLLIAGIGITLSWSLCQFLVHLFNDLGSWIEAILTFPFPGIKDASGGVGWGLGAIMGVFFSLGAGAILAIFLGWPGIMSLLGSAALAMLLGAAVLIIRQMIIVLCVLTSPLWIACSVLPNTQKGFKLGGDTFIRTLAMYPIVIGFITIGMVFSWLSSAQGASGGASSPLAGIISIAAYILPYFFLPYAFKLSGGAVAGVAGLVQDKSKPFLDKQKEKRGEIMKENRALSAAGQRFKGNNKFTSALANAYRPLGMGLGSGMQGKWGLAGLMARDKNRKWYNPRAYGLGAVGKDGKRNYQDANGTWHRNRTNTKYETAVTKNMRHAAHEYAESFAGKDNLGNDDFTEAMTGGRTAVESRKHMFNLYQERAVNKARQTWKETHNDSEEGFDEAAVLRESKHESEHEAAAIVEKVRQEGGFGGAYQVAGFKAFAETGTAYDYGEAGTKKLSQMMAKAAQGSKELMGHVAADMNNATARAGRQDQSFGYGQTLNMGLNAMAQSDSQVSEAFLKGRATYVDEHGNTQSTAGTIHDNGQRSRETGTTMSMQENAYQRSTTNKQVTDKEHVGRASGELARNKVQEGIALVSSENATAQDIATGHAQIAQGMRIAQELQGARAQANGHAMSRIDNEVSKINDIVGDYVDRNVQGARNTVAESLSHDLARGESRSRSFEVARADPIVIPQPPQSRIRQPVGNGGGRRGAGRSPFDARPRGGDGMSANEYYNNVVPPPDA